MTLYIAGASLFTDELVKPFFSLVGSHLVEPWRNGPYMDSVGVPLAYLIVVVMLGLPQLAFALIGGFLARRAQDPQHSKLIGRGP